jgi:hypothetical protein
MNSRRYCLIRRTIMKKRIHDFINKHGYSLKAYWLAVFIFPPAAIFIAWKKPGWTILHRVLGLLVPIAVIASGPFIGSVLVLKLYEFVVSIFGA